MRRFLTAKVFAGTNVDLIDTRERLAGAGNLPRESNHDIGDREQHGQQPAEGGCKGARPMANLPFHQGHG